MLFRSYFAAGMQLRRGGATMSPSLLLIASLPLPPIFVAFACRHVQGATSMSLSLRRCSLHQRRHRLPCSLLLTPFRRTSFKPYILVPSLNMLQHVRRIALSFCFKSGAVWHSNSFVHHKTAAASRDSSTRASLSQP